MKPRFCKDCAQPVSGEAVNNPSCPNCPSVLYELHWGGEVEIHNFGTGALIPDEVIKQLTGGID